MPRASKTDPTGQGVNRRRAFRALARRLTRAEVQVKALFRAIPRSRRTQTRIVNQETPIYDYDIPPSQRSAMQARIAEIINRELETQAELDPPDWFYRDDIEPPYREGTLQEVNEFNQLISAAIIAGLLIRGLPPQRIPPELVLVSPEYLEALNQVYVTSYSDIKSLSERTASQVIQRVNAGITSGKTPTEIGQDIAERFDVSRSNAQRIAITEVNAAYTNAKMDAATLAANQTGLRAGVIHISALLSTTRPHHAARHGNAYTVADQRQWWDTGSNRINCKCSVQSVLIDSSGRVVQKELQQDFKEERKTFDD